MIASPAKNFAAVCKSPMANAPTSLDFFVGRNIPAVSIVLGGRPWQIKHVDWSKAVNVIAERLCATPARKAA